MVYGGGVGLDGKGDGGGRVSGDKGVWRGDGGRVWLDRGNHPRLIHLILLNTGLPT